MNKTILFASFITIIVLHYVAFTYIYKKEMPQLITKPPYQKVTVQLAAFKKPEPVIKDKPIIKKIEKPKIKKEVFKKPIKKDAKRKLVKKSIIKEKPKKIVKKKVVEKKTVEKKVVEKKIVEKKTQQNVAKKVAAASLEKFKQFKQNYLTQLRVEIDKNKKYPRISRRLEEEGLVTVSFRVLNSGSFENIKIISSSGKKRLDKAALKAVIKTASFKPFDKNINKAYMDLSLPMRFKLN